MLYLLAILLPPIAVLMAGKPLQAIINLVLTLCCWFPGVWHAVLVVGEYYSDVRFSKIEKHLRRRP